MAQAAPETPSGKNSAGEQPGGGSNTHFSPNLSPYDPETPDYNDAAGNNHPDRPYYGSGDLSPLTRPHGDTASALQDAETSAANQSAGTDTAENKALTEAEGREKPGGDSSPSNEGGQGKRRGFPLKGLANRLGGQKKLLAIGGFSSFFGVFGILILLVFLASLLKIPNLAQDIIDYQFARMTRQFADTADRTTSEALAVETADDTPAAGEPRGLRGAITDRYQALRDSTQAKLDKIVPSRIAANFKENNLKLNTHQSILGKTVPEGTPFSNTVLDSVELKGKTYKIPPQRGFVRSFIPEFLDIPFLKQQNDFAREFVPALKESIRSNEIGPVIDSYVASKIRQQLGINLVAWDLEKFQGKTEQQARYEMEREMYNKISENGTETPQAGLVDDLNNAQNQAQEATNQDVAKDNTLQQIIDKQGVDANAEQAAENAAKDNIGKEIVGFANPAYQFALPACMMFEGSLDRAGPSINTNVKNQTRAFYEVASAADEQKAGGPYDRTGTAEARAVGAMNQKLGDTTKSNPYLRASGGSTDTSKSAMSAEVGPMGDFTLIDAIPELGGSGVGNVIKQAANKGCPILTNIWVAGGTGALILLASIIADTFTAGGASIGEAAATTAADAAVREVSVSLTERFVASVAQRFTAKKIGAFIANAAADTAKLTALVIIAKLIVLWRSNTLYDGLEQSADFANEADAGGNIHAGELERQQLFGRPLTCPEIGQSNTADKSFLATNNQAQSVADRYLAVSNPNSLLSLMALATSGQIESSLPQTASNFTNTVASALSLHAVLRPFFGPVQAAAPASCGNQNYGNVQFGWSEAEIKLAHSNSSYFPLENQEILDRSGKEEAIAQQYAACFGYAYTHTDNGSLDPTDPNSELQSDSTDGDGSLGSLLTGNGEGDAAIVRDANGNVIADQGLCSPQNLGANNPTYGDLVLRWRLAMAYDTTMNQLTGLQTVSK